MPPISQGRVWVTGYPVTVRVVNVDENERGSMPVMAEPEGRVSWPPTPLRGSDPL